MSFHNTPTFKGPAGSKIFRPSKFQNIPSAGGRSRGPRLSVPLFGDRPKPIEQMKANTPAFRGPAKLPTNFLKNAVTGNFSQSRNPRAELFNGPLLGLHGGPRAGHKKSVSRKVKKRTKRKK